MFSILYDSDINVGGGPNKAVTKVIDIVCKDRSNRSFPVCKKHRNEFVKSKHYKEVTKK